jgi:hypothetical protein
VVGVLVAGVMVALLQFDFVEGIDRYVIDVLMSQRAKNEFKAPTAATAEAPHFLYIDIGEKTCRKWASELQGTSCTLGVVTSRVGLCQLFEQINNSRPKPLLVVIDIELSPLSQEAAGSVSPAQGCQPDPANKNISSPCKEPGCKTGPDSVLRSQVFDLAGEGKVPVIALRPMVIDPKSSSPLIRYPSILDGDCKGGNTAPCQLWFASAIIQPNSDGVVRSVHACDKIWNENRFEPIAGIGLLGAMLLNPAAKPNSDPLVRLKPDDVKKSLSEVFPGSRSHRPGSKAVVESCPPLPISIGKSKYGSRSENPQDEDYGWVTNHIMFWVPFDDPGFGYNPLVIDTVEASELENRLRQNPQLLKDKVVVIGGSYLTSGDLHTTPLGPRMPGAMVHSNAIRAYKTDTFVEERGFQDWEFWEVKLALIGIAALVTAFFHVLSVGIAPFVSPSSHILGLHASRAHIMRASFAVVGVITAVLLGVQSLWAGDKLVGASIVAVLAAGVGVLLHYLRSGATDPDSVRIIVLLTGVAFGVLVEFMISTWGVVDKPIATETAIGVYLAPLSCVLSLLESPVNRRRVLALLAGVGFVALVVAVIGASGGSDNLVKIAFGIVLAAFVGGITGFLVVSYTHGSLFLALSSVAVLLVVGAQGAIGKRVVAGTVIGFLVAVFSILSVQWTRADRMRVLPLLTGITLAASAVLVTGAWVGFIEAAIGIALAGLIGAFLIALMRQTHRLRIPALLGGVVLAATFVSVTAASGAFDEPTEIVIGLALAALIGIFIMLASHADRIRILALFTGVTFAAMNMLFIGGAGQLDKLVQAGTTIGLIAVLTAFAGGLFPRMLVSLLGASVALLAVFTMGTWWAFNKLVESGTAVGTLTPALAVAFEGLCEALHRIKPGPAPIEISERPRMSPERKE